MMLLQLVKELHLLIAEVRRCAMFISKRKTTAKSPPKQLTTERGLNASR